MTNTIFMNTESGENAALNSAFEEHLDLLDRAPFWWKDMKRKAFEKYCELPAPARNNENWRFAKTKGLQPEDIDFAAIPSINDAQSLVQRSNLISKRSGQFVFADNQTIDSQAIAPELAKQGVIFSTIKQALAKEPEVLRGFFMKQGIDLGSEKFAALHTAFIENGIILYVPRGVEVEDPFVIYNWATSSKIAALPHTLVIAEEFSKVSVIEAQFSSNDETPNFSIGVNHIFAGVGSKVSHTLLQDFNEETLGFQINSNEAAKDSLVKTLSVNVGCRRYRSETHGQIMGAGAHVEMLSLVAADAEQEIDQRTLQTHNAPHATSDLLFKNTLADSSKTIFSGLIKVAEEAQQTDAYQTNRNLLLTQTAEANSLPGLEIEANDVKCSHGATTSQIDPEEIFYMNARGIDKGAAHELIVYGFFEEIISRIDCDELAENVRQLIQTKFKK